MNSNSTLFNSSDWFFLDKYLMSRALNILHYCPLPIPLFENKIYNFDANDFSILQADGTFDSNKATPSEIHLIHSDPHLTWITHKTHSKAVYKRRLVQASFLQPDSTESSIGVLIHLSILSALRHASILPLISVGYYPIETIDNQNRQNITNWPLVILREPGGIPWRDYIRYPMTWIQKLQLLRSLILSISLIHHYHAYIINFSEADVFVSSSNSKDAKIQISGLFGMVESDSLLNICQPLEQSDNIFSLGVLMLSCLTGTVIDRPNEADLNKWLEPIAAKIPLDCPEPLEALTLCCCGESSANRPVSMQCLHEITSELDALLGSANRATQSDKSLSNTNINPFEELDYPADSTTSLSNSGGDVAQDRQIRRKSYYTNPFSEYFENVPLNPPESFNEGELFSEAPKQRKSYFSNPFSEFCDTAAPASLSPPIIVPEKRFSKSVSLAMDTNEESKSHNVRRFSEHLPQEQTSTSTQSVMLAQEPSEILHSNNSANIDIGEAEDDASVSDDSSVHAFTDRDLASSANLREPLISLKNVFPSLNEETRVHDFRGSSENKTTEGRKDSTKNSTPVLMLSSKLLALEYELNRELENPQAISSERDRYDSSSYHEMIESARQSLQRLSNQLESISTDYIRRESRDNSTRFASPEASSTIYPIASEPRGNSPSIGRRYSLSNIGRRLSMAQAESALQLEIDESNYTDSASHIIADGALRTAQSFLQSIRQLDEAYAKSPPSLPFVSPVSEQKKKPEPPLTYSERFSRSSNSTGNTGRSSSPRRKPANMDASNGSSTQNLDQALQAYLSLIQKCSTTSTQAKKLVGQLDQRMETLNSSQSTLGKSFSKKKSSPNIRQPLVKEVLSTFKNSPGVSIRAPTSPTARRISA